MAYDLWLTLAASNLAIKEAHNAKNRDEKARTEFELALARWIQTHVRCANIPMRFCKQNPICDPTIIASAMEAFGVAFDGSQRAEAFARITIRCGAAVIALVTTAVLIVTWQSRSWTPAQIAHPCVNPGARRVYKFACCLVNPMIWAASILPAVPIAFVLFDVFKATYCAGICRTLAAVEYTAIAAIAFVFISVAAVSKGPKNHYHGLSHSFQGCPHCATVA